MKKYIDSYSLPEDRAKQIIGHIMSVEGIFDLDAAIERGKLICENIISCYKGRGLMPHEEERMRYYENVKLEIEKQFSL